MTNEEMGLYLYGAGKKEHDINNIYGYNNFNLPQELEGCYIWYFTTTAEDNFAPYAMSGKKGRVLLDGKDIPFKYMKKDIGWNPWFVAVDIRRLGFVTGKSYTITITGFETESGEFSEPVDTVIECVPYIRDEKYKEHDEMTLVTAQEGAVLLKNNNKLLPLKEKRINVFGDAYYRFYNMSGGAGSINPRYSIGFVEGLEKYGNFELNPELLHFFTDGFGTVPDKDMIERAKEYSDTAVITVSRGSKEATDNNPDKGGYYLTDEEEQLIKNVTAVFENTIAILNVGWQIDVRWVEKYNVKAVLWFGYAGQAAGQALADVLSGKVSPSGHLPDTWAYDYYDYPSAKNFITNDDVDKTCDKPLVENVYEEGIYVGYRYFDTFKIPVAYPFGYGLSYTEFEKKFVSADYENGCLKASVKVKNIGKCAGKEVLQLYVKEPDGKLEKCSHKLIDFAKTRLLKPSEEDVLEFCVADREFSSFFEENATMIMEKGEYKIYVGENINSLEEIFSFTLKEDKVLQRLHNYCKPPRKINEISKYGKSKADGCSFCDCKNESFDFSKTQRKKFVPKKLNEYSGDIISYEEAEKNPFLLDDFVAQMSVEELARISVCAQAWTIDAFGVAGSVFPVEKYKMKPFLSADGNTTVRMSKRMTGFPSSNMICASFNREMSYTVGRVIAEEAYEEKIHLILAPGMNIHRNPLCGRNAEYFSEDVVLSGVMAGYMTKGLQDNKVAACLKHIVANNAELSRKRSNSVMSERALREIYVRNFEIAMQTEMPESIMTSYNALNNKYTATDEELMMGIFREELGFCGYIMTDWESYETVDWVEAVNAGNCWITPGSSDDKYTKPIVEGVANGSVDVDRLRENVRWHISIMIKYTIV